MIGIIGAMKEEVDALKEHMNINETKEVLDTTLYVGTIKEKDVVVMQGGIGKVNAAICCMILFEQYPMINTVINIGSAGGLVSSQNVGDLVISSDVIHHDVDVTAFGRVLGEIPDMPLRFVSDKELVSLTEEIVQEMNIPHYLGTIVSGDQFIATNKQAAYIQEHFPDALCAEMEAAAIAQTCYKLKKRFIIIRSLSDVFGKGDSSIQFDEFLAKASAASAIMCATLVARL